MDRLEKAIEMGKEYNSACFDSRDCEECKYIKEDCELGHSIKALLKWDKIIAKEKSIVLKNIDLSNVKYLSQRNKVKEERKKFTDAVGEYNLHIRTRINSEEFKEIEAYSKNYMIEAFWDMVQAGLGLIQKTGISADEVMAEYPKHILKMEQRGNKPREKVQRWEQESTL